MTAPAPARLPTGGRINRDQELSFQFDGKTYTGYKGDTLASALLANGVKVVGRSFKYHRPRGIFTAGEEEPCALLELGDGDARIPTCRATMIPLTEGLVCRSQNCWPSVQFDAGRVIDFTHALWPAGFYNKTFKWPNWHTWENLVRKSAGLGRPLTGPDPDHYEKVNVHCDLLICGAGPAGLIAALAATRAGLRVILAEQATEPGGSLNWENYQLDDEPAHRWAQDALETLRKAPNVTILPRTTVLGVYDHLVTTMLQTGSGTQWRECLWIVRPRHILVAAGAIEQGLIFPNNDRPGIMLAGAVRHYFNRFAVQPGKKVVVATNNDTAYQTVIDLVQGGVEVSAVVDSRKDVSDELRSRMAELGTQLLSNARIRDTHGSKGINAVQIEDMDGSSLGKRKCDLLAVSGGWAPRVHLLAHAAGKLVFDDDSQSFLPGSVPAGLSIAGSASGIAELNAVLADSVAKIAALCESFGKSAPEVTIPTVTSAIIESSRVAPIKIDRERKRQWIDLAHDVTFGDAELAVREGFVSVEHFKRYTTTGMSVDQGKTGNINAFIVLGALTGREAGQVGTTTFRPPYMPATVGAVAGRNTGEFYAPRRLLPAHTSHVELNAKFEDYGWMRPDCYPREGESPALAIRREAAAVRNSVGVFDNSPIGKLEVRGPDAAELLNRVYINNALTLKPGKARYGLMLNENGVIIDDGVFVRLAEDHFLVHTTSGGVGRIGAMMDEWLQCEWTDLQVLVDDTTTQWANFTIAGPRAREVLAALGTDIDISREALPHMSAAVGHVAGLEARVVRVSFSGELSYEINIPAGYANSMFKAILAAGGPFGITPYGVESLMTLRIEKGYLHLGSDTDGSSTPDDVGWGHVARKKASDYIGKRSLFRTGNTDPDRKQFVGLEPLDATQELRPGTHLLIGEERQPPAVTDGWITSGCFSPNLERHIGLGVLNNGANRLGEILTACDEEQRYRVRVVSPVFYDPDNQKLSQ